MYRGLESMVYFATPKAAIRFSSKEAFSNMLPNELGKAKGFLAGLGAGTCEAIFVTTPQETIKIKLIDDMFKSATCLLYTSPSPRDGLLSRMPSSA